MRQILTGIIGFLILTTLMDCKGMCIKARVIRQTGDTAIIQGRGQTKIEAQLEAEEKAALIFGRYEIQGEPDCTQEYHASSSVSGSASGGISGSGSGYTYWSCVIHFKKQ